MSDVTSEKQKKSLDTTVTLNKNDKLSLAIDPARAVVLYPALGNPAIVRTEKTGTDKDGKNIYNEAVLELILLSKDKNLQRGQVASHLKISTWAKKDLGATVNDKTVLNTYYIDPAAVNVSECYPADTESLGLGLEGKDKDDKQFGTKLNHINVFPWIFPGLSAFPCLYKVSIKLKNYTPGMYNIWWVNKDDYFAVRKRYKWWDLIGHMKDWTLGSARQPRPFKKQLKDYGGDMTDSGVGGKTPENIKASIYHPFFVTTKETLNIGHVTDLHLDSRMELYGQSEASVIEVEENCPPKADGKERHIVNKDFHIPIKKKIANFNRIFTDICDKLINKKADIIVITGDLVDYNRGIHTPQTYRTCFTKISDMWDALSSSVSENKYYRNDRNWFLFYRKLLELYDRMDAVPVFTMLGNHDYVNYGMAPWPVFGIPWNGVFDQNLTLYESALSFGDGYNSSGAFIGDVREKSDYVEWYSIFINPFADFVVNYGDQSLYMVDWGVKSNVIGHGLKTKVVEPVIPGYKAAGGLHHARHLFRKKTDYETVTSHGGEAEPTVQSYEPFPVRNYSIYESWITQTGKIKVLFMHATGICPRPDVSIGEVNHDLSWTQNELQYGSFDYRHDEIIQDVEDGKLNLIVAGHSHQNVVMSVDGKQPGRVRVLGSGEDYGTVTHPAKNLVMVTSSGGPLPTIFPGGPLICACPEKYEHGWDYKRSFTGKESFFEYTYGDKKTPVPLNGKNEAQCPRCGMAAKDMTRKIAKRHRPGGSLLMFDGKGEDGNHAVIIESVPTDEKGGYPRLGALNDEYGIFTEDMKLEHIENGVDYKKWDDDTPISIISRSSFTCYGYMELPHYVQYVTFLNKGDGGKKGLRGENHFNVAKMNHDNNQVIFKQEIGKDELNALMRSAQNKNDFAFVRYVYLNSPQERWDREIKMFQDFQSDPDHSSDRFKPGENDPYNSLVIDFIRKPNLKKRKEVCGY